MNRALSWLRNHTAVAVGKRDDRTLGSGRLANTFETLKIQAMPRTPMVDAEPNPGRPEPDTQGHGLPSRDRTHFQLADGWPAAGKNLKDDGRRRRRRPVASTAEATSRHRDRKAGRCSEGLPVRSWRRGSLASLRVDGRWRSSDAMASSWRKYSSRSVAVVQSGRPRLRPRPAFQTQPIAGPDGGDDDRRQQQDRCHGNLPENGLGAKRLNDSFKKSSPEEAGRCRLLRETRARNTQLSQRPHGFPDGNGS